jgi:hypothetical protein
MRPDNEKYCPLPEKTILRAIDGPVREVIGAIRAVKSVRLYF